MSSGPFLIGAETARYRALGEGGDLVWRRATQLRAAVDTRLGKRHAELFAIPRAGETSDRVDWYAPFEGAARAWSDLAEPERRALQAKVQELRPELERLVERLDAAGRSDGERAFGKLLRHALIAPGPETLFAVDGKPVLAFWGFAPDDGKPGQLLGIAAAPAASLPTWNAPTMAAPPPSTTIMAPSSTTIVAPPSTTVVAPPSAPTMAQPPGGYPPPPGMTQVGAYPPPPGVYPPPPGAYPPPPGGYPPPPGGGYPPPPPGGFPPPPMAAAAAQPPSNWWKWTLVASILLLALAGSAYLVAPYLPLWNGMTQAQINEEVARRMAGAPGAPGGVAVLDRSALDAETRRTEALTTDLQRLLTQVVEKRAQCTPGRQGSVIVPGGTVPGTTVPGGTVPGTGVPGGPVVGGPGTVPAATTPGAERGPAIGPDGKPLDPSRTPKAGELDPGKGPGTAPRPGEPKTAMTPPEKGKGEPGTTPRPPEAKPGEPQEKGKAGPGAAPKGEPKTAATTPPPAGKPIEPKVEAAPGPAGPQGKAPGKPGEKPFEKPAEKPIEQIKLPPGPGTGFLEGTWRSDTDLTTQSGEEVRPQYTFDKDGKGTTKITQKNGVVCEGPAQATREADGKLVIRESEALKCSDGTTFAPSTVTCAPGQQGVAQCTGRSEGGPPYTVRLGR
ncbi:MAG: hypothetical protein IPK81_07380 [Rhodospirillales bacterium]|nr:MAG: hypothetical protein IPK81_07380 [Rhodospirillales bacterium]